MRRAQPSERERERVRVVLIKGRREVSYPFNAPMQWGRVHATHNHLMTNYDTSKRGREGWWVQRGVVL
jgi:hypothetical protein